MSDKLVAASMQLNARLHFELDERRAKVLEYLLSFDAFWVIEHVGKQFTPGELEELRGPLRSALTVELARIKRAREAIR